MAIGNDVVDAVVVDAVVVSSTDLTVRAPLVLVVESTGFVPMESVDGGVDAHPAITLTPIMTPTADLDNLDTGPSLPDLVPAPRKWRSLVRMTRSGRFHPVRLWRDYGIRLMRYGGVTVVSSVVGLTTLAIGIVVIGWPAVFANFVSVVVSTPPAYLLNRHWVWGRDPGGHSVSGEIGPFWILTFLGWVVSTIAVGAADLVTNNDFLLITAQVAAFAALWLVKFAFLEKYLWRHHPHPVHPVAEQV